MINQSVKDSLNAVLFDCKLKKSLQELYRSVKPFLHSTSL